VLGVADTYGIELLHPIRKGRSESQTGKKGKSNHRWIIGGKLRFVLNKFGLVTHWECATANVHDSHFQPLVGRWEADMIVLTDTGFHAHAGDPPNMKICQRGTWNVRMLSAIRNPKSEIYIILAQWHGLIPYEHGFVHLSVAQFSL